MENHEQAEQILRRQLTAFAQFTTRSLGESNIDSLMMDACLRARAGMNMTHAKLMEYLPERDRLLLRAGGGWKDGYVGQYRCHPISIPDRTHNHGPHVPVEEPSTAS